MQRIPSSEITPEHVYLNRRKFMIAAGSLSAGALALAACNTALPSGGPSGSGATAEPALNAEIDPALLPEPLAYSEPYASSEIDELGDPLNKFEEITNYNNYYEFTTNKEGVAREAEAFDPYPWQVEVSGLVNNPKTYDLDEIYARFDQEERIYRLRCVEAWSMVIPWVGFPIAAMLKEVEPKAEAKFVKFVSILRPEEMRGQTIWDAGLALSRGSASRRSNEPAGYLCDRYVRQATHQSAGGSVPTGRALEVRFQEHQRDRQDRTHRHDSRVNLDGLCTQRIWLLCQRQPGSQSPALVTGERATHRRDGTPTHADVQRLRRRGCLALRGHESEE